MAHDSTRSGENHETDLSRWQELGDPLLDLSELNVESWRDDSALVQSSVELDDNLSGSVVVDLLEFADVAWKR